MMTNDTLRAHSLLDALTEAHSKFAGWLERRVSWSHDDVPGAEAARELFDTVSQVKDLLSANQLALQASDVDKLWDGALGELCSGELQQMIACTYRNKMVSASDLCWDAWPDRGPLRSLLFLKRLEILSSTFCGSSIVDCAQARKKKLDRYHERLADNGFRLAVETLSKLSKEDRDITRVSKETAKEGCYKPGTLRAYLSDTREIWDI